MGDRQPLLQIIRKAPELSPVAAEQLRAVAAARQRRAPDERLERCELCGAGIEAEHSHVVNVAARALLCVCRPCYLLFTHDGAGGSRFRAVPERYQLVPELTDAVDRWEGLEVPIDLAFFFRNSATGRTTAFYPSPAGATESELSLAAWDAMTDAAPALATLQPDVEALLIRRASSPGPLGGDGGASLQALIVPIDACYELVGRIRQAWTGLQGGDELWREVDAYFAHATARARMAAR